MLGTLAGHSTLHSRNTFLFLNIFTDLVSPQLHLLFDEKNSTISSSRDEIIPSNCESLYVTNSFHITCANTNEDLTISFDLAYVDDEIPKNEVEENPTLITQNKGTPGLVQADNIEVDPNLAVNDGDSLLNSTSGLKDLFKYFKNIDRLINRRYKKNLKKFHFPAFFVQVFYSFILDPMGHAKKY